MQKSFIAIALALTLTSAFGAYTATNYVTAPVVVSNDSDTSYTNQTVLGLASFTSGNVYLYSATPTVNLNNVSASTWSLFYRQLNTKTLAATVNSTASPVAPLAVSFLNNYVIGYGVDNTTNAGALNLWAYQVPLTSGTTGPGRLQLSNNTNVNFTVAPVGTAAIGTTVYVAYLAANNTANITSFTAGGSTVGTPFTLSTTFDTPNSLSLTWGEALGSSQLFAVWIENGALKDAVIDGSKRTVGTPTTITPFNQTTQSCSGIATDKKLYGEFCTGRDPNNFNYTLYWVRTTANGTLVQIANYTSSTSMFAGVVPYGPYIAVFFADSTAASGINYAYEIWTLDTFNTTSVQARKQYLNIDANSTQVPFRVVSGGFYTLLFNKPQVVNGTLGTRTNIQVGLVLGSSYLASVLGFLLTIVAGLFLF